ncbi:hypothetical protein [Blastococcus goldschmidtiae]|uniref:ARB-07466-like C-terminal domain-containing protein n=1 Tax=Blastococcus goldschmidtiae TaxID=3075546 RepID=A0ABU2K5C4_9ACTN|nr:hypothetical protein [Blastococcus sp. DSM 46792]MDT0275394.1 hypothetical protein [Blastococcus sp. DSM 46792]
MHPRTTVSHRPARSHRRSSSHRRPPAAVRRPGIYLGVAAAGALVVNLVIGAGPAAQAEAVSTESVSVARQLGLEATPAPEDVTRELEPLAEIAASRSAREDAEAAALMTQAAADQAVLDQRRVEAEAAAAAAAAAQAQVEAEAEAEAAARRAAEEAAAARRAAEEAAAAERAAERAAEQPTAAARPAPKAPAAAVAQAAGSVAATVRARIRNTAGAINPRAQAAADAVVSNVPGAGSIALGGTRASAADPGGHPSGLAVDYMVMTNAALGDAIAAYHVAHWNELGVDYVIWQQRMLSSPGGSWKQMENRGGVTANHFDHVHVNYR